MNDVMLRIYERIANAPVIMLFRHVRVDGDCVGATKGLARIIKLTWPEKQVYIIDDEHTLDIHKFECEYRAIRRDELSKRFTACGCREVAWLFPEQTGFYQPIVVAKK